jgi:hypothetical protein
MNLEDGKNKEESNHIRVQQSINKAVVKNNVTKKMVEKGVQIEKVILEKEVDGLYDF